MFGARVFLAAVLTSSSTAALCEPVALFGEVGKHAALVLVGRSGDEISGWFLYLDRGKQIRLDGRVDGDGAFLLTETSEGKAAGAFTGRVRDGRWTGEWRDPAGRSRLPLDLRETKARASDLGGRYSCETKTRVRAGGYSYAHSLTLGVTGGVVRELMISRDAKGGGDDQSCSVDLSALRQVPASSGILLKSRGAAGEADRGPRCSIRIFGDDRFLYVRMGDMSDADDDCRAAGDAMLCSARGTWTDMIVNRATKRCTWVE